MEIVVAKFDNGGSFVVNFDSSRSQDLNFSGQFAIEPDLEQMLHCPLKSGRRVPGQIHYGRCHTMSTNHEYDNGWKFPGRLHPDFRADFVAM